MKNILQNRKIRRVMSLIITVSVLISSLGINLISMADENSEIVSWVLHSGNTVRNYKESFYQTINTGVLGILEGQTVNEVYNVHSGSSSQRPSHALKESEGKFADLGITANDVNAVSIFIKGDSDKEINFRLHPRTGPTHAWAKNKVYLYDSKLGTVTEKNADGGNVFVPAGFHGYVIYDRASADETTANNFFARIDDPFMDTFINGSHNNGVTFYYGDVRAWNSAVEGVLSVIGQETPDVEKADFYQVHNGDTVRNYKESVYQTITTGVEDILEGQKVNQVYNVHSGSSSQRPSHALKESEGKFADLGITANDVKAVSIFIKGDSNKEINFRLHPRTGATYSWAKNKVYLYDSKLGIVSETNADGGNVFVPAGFYGYVIYDRASADETTANNFFGRIDDPFMDTFINGSHNNGVTFYYGDVRAWTKDVDYILTKLGYKVNTDVPDIQVVNDGSSLIMVDSSEALSVTLCDGLSPNGSAYLFKGLSQNGASLFSVRLNPIDKALIPTKQAFSMWVNIPSDMQYIIQPCFNKEVHGIYGTWYTYNTVTGEYKGYSNVNGLTLEGFEGYIFVDLASVQVATDFSGTKIPFSEFIESNQISSIAFYNRNVRTSGKTFAIDHLAWIADLDGYCDEIKSAPLRPSIPVPSIKGGAVADGTSIKLSADDGTEIYYTLDGTTPSAENGEKYVEASLGAGGGTFSPIVITGDTVLKAVAIKNGISSGVLTAEYTLELPYTGPNNVVLNDGSGEGKNTVNWVEPSYWSTEFKEGYSPDGKAIVFKCITESKNANLTFFSGEYTSLEKPHKLQAISLYVNVPKYENNKKFPFKFRFNNEANCFTGKVYAIEDNTGKVTVSQGGGIALSDFKGRLVICIGDTVGTNYGNSSMSFEDFIKNIGFERFGYYYSLQPEFNGTELAIDDIQAHYSLEELMVELGIEALLKTYDAGTYENANMLVTNDCSYSKLNGSFSAISEGLKVEDSNYSYDARCIKLTFGETDGKLNFLNYCQSEDAKIADGVVFWVEQQAGSGETKLQLRLTDATNNAEEKYYYDESQRYYLIDKNGTISRRSGAITLPDAFRGWVIIPGDAFFVDKENSAKFDNGNVDYAGINDIELTIYNSNKKLNGKTMYLDDMSFYVDFASLVKSRAVRWEGQTFSK